MPIYARHRGGGRGGGMGVTGMESPPPRLTPPSLKVCEAGLQAPESTCVNDQVLPASSPPRPARAPGAGSNTASSPPWYSAQRGGENEGESKGGRARKRGGRERERGERARGRARKRGRKRKGERESKRESYRKRGGETRGGGREGGETGRETDGGGRDRERRGNERQGERGGNGRETQTGRQTDRQTEDLQG